MEEAKKIWKTNQPRREQLPEDMRRLLDQLDQAPKILVC